VVMSSPRVTAMAGALLMLLPSPMLRTVPALGTDGVAHGSQAKPGQPQTPKKSATAELAEPWPDAAKLAERRKDAEARRLFQDVEPLAFTLAADFKAVNRDRTYDSCKTFPAVLTVKGQEGSVPVVPLQVTLRTRGSLRLRSDVCAFAPLGIEFVKQGAKRTAFEGQSKLKLVTHCNENQASDQLVLLEYLAYRLYNLMTPRSFRVRLAQATYVDSKSGRTLSTHNAVFIEDDDDVARRMEGRAVTKTGLLFKDFDQESLTLMTVFQYMIGNPDYSVNGMHNVRLVQTAGNVRYPITWDFDVTGLVDPQYAISVPQVRKAIAGVRTRSYLGPCRSAEELEPTLAAFRAKQAEMLAIVGSIPGLDDAGRRRAAEYLGEFFAVIGSKDLVKRELIDTCHDRPTI
jgi:hypothetical protein